MKPNETMLRNHSDLFSESNYLEFKQNNFKDNHKILGNHETIDDQNEIEEKEAEE